MTDTTWKIELLNVDGEEVGPVYADSRDEARTMAQWYRTHSDNVVTTKITKQS